MSKPCCPICRADAASPSEPNSPFPFCSGRCKLIDLGNWLDGRYRIPATPSLFDEFDEELNDLPS